MIAQDHSFFIPVMGTAFTIDTPLKVARFGVSSVISLCDDELCETMRKHYSPLFKLPYSPISKNDDDFRAKRITAYLNMVHQCINLQIESMKTLSLNDENPNDLKKYFELLPEESPKKEQYNAFQQCTDLEKKTQLEADLKTQVEAGSIDVNIMTKLDRDIYDKNGQKVEGPSSDALAALRGYANSELESAIVFSAGFNRRLYAYIEQFNDFFPNKNGHIKKRVILKVSDYRSSLTQGKFLAKKGIWTSEFRVESGLNCGGHAFASDGYLLGPILEEFKQNKDELLTFLQKTCNQTLEKNAKPLLAKTPICDITVQGGIGTNQEQNFLRERYPIKKTGWATPFLLVPEVTTIDDETRLQLSNAREKDLFLSPISPLGVPFNALKDTASEQQKEERFQNGRPGSPCPKGYLMSNTEFSKKPVCTASIFYQKRKIASLEALGLGAEKLKEEIKKVIAKACLCEDLAAGALLTNAIANKRSLKTAVCPGPNLAYFSKISTFKDMVNHIYGKMNLLNTTQRPHMFIKELSMYIDYFKTEVNKRRENLSNMDIKYLDTFQQNLNDGINYYHELLPRLTSELNSLSENLQNIIKENIEIFEPVTA